MKAYLLFRLTLGAIAAVSGIYTESFEIPILSLAVAHFFSGILNQDIKHNLHYLILAGTVLYAFKFDFLYFYREDNYLILTSIILANLAVVYTEYSFLKKKG